MNGFPMLDDELVRRAITEELGTTFLVEAAAGTGKTTSLVSRMVSLVREGVAAVDTIAAITFTVKAAAQLRQRFQETLEKARPGSSTEEQRRIDDAIASLDRCFIGTTHAFCARLLRERPVEAGLDPEFTEVDAVEILLLANDFWDRYVEKISLAGLPALDELRACGVNLNELRQGFVDLIEYPDVEIVSTETPRPDLSYVHRRLSDLLGEIEPHLPSASDGHKQDNFEVLVRELLQKRRTVDDRDPAELVNFLEAADHRSRRPTQRNWPDGQVAKAFGESYRDFVVTVLGPALTRWREHTHWVAFGILRPALEEFAAERRQTGRLSFQDLLMCARDLLRSHAHVRAYFQRRFTHLLVDEFQDTDPIQAEVMFFLTGEKRDEKDWRKLRPRPGSLFIVGDPKQSIYRFRRADITTYLQVKDQITATDGKVVALVSNFRSNRVVCDWVNDTVGPLFEAADVAAGRQAQYSPLAATYEAGISSGVYHLETPQQRNDDAAASEAMCLAAWIKGSVENGTEIEENGKRRQLMWKDVMLVSWSRLRLDIYADMLERAAIPCEVAGSRGFARGEELRALVPLLRSLVDPDDQVSLVAFLRGPFCGVDDQALYDFVATGGRFRWLRKSEIPGLDRRIERAFATLREAWKESRELPPAATVARLVERLGIAARAAAGERGGTRSGNLLKTISIARSASAEGASLAAIVDHLELILEGSDIAEMDIDPDKENAVRLMNLHQVKGLEAPVVFLIDPSPPWEPGSRLFIDRAGDQSRGFFTLSKKFGRSTKVLAQPPDWQGMAALDAQFDSAEKRRLLYVAATRAMSMLVVGSQPLPQGLKGAWGSLVGKLKDPLAIPEELPGMASGSVEVAEPANFEAAMRSIAQDRERAKSETYSVVPVTKVAHGDHRQLVRVEEGLGRGMSWGRVLHRLLEAMLKDQSLDLRSFAENLLKDEEREPAEIDDVMMTIEALQQSELWKRVLRSEQRMVEVPFAVMTSAKEIGLSDDGNTLLHGAIDLVFLEDGIWHIVDYKTDSIEGAGRLESLVEYYAPQVRAYVRFWSEITRQPAKGGLFFVAGPVETWL
ncbi:MAG TPA: UvrD-helicase domain-containing protein [Thermoanaerobaculia bacterium]|nr:UvrD-helicase domain-containing protein [Thermoanaerobaculia bacterium]